MTVSGLSQINMARGGFDLKAVFLLCIAAIGAMSLPNLLDPMIRYDDYPALFAEGDLFWEKTLNEGRWVNYLWHLRSIVTPAWLNFGAYQALWALFAAATATVVMRQNGFTFFKATLALLILVSPSALLISLWFNTLLPGLALVALFSLLACKLSYRSINLLLPIFVVLTFMAYTTYPLLLLVICLYRQDNRSLPKLIALLAFFTASFIAAILLTYTINWSVHGVFGVPLADWRDATPAHNLAELTANLPKLVETFSGFLAKTSFEFYPAQIFHLMMFFGSAVVLTRYEPLEAAYIYAGLFTGLSLITLQVLKLGVTIPPRTFIFARVFYGIAVVRAVEILSAKHVFSGRMAGNAALLIVGSYLLQSYSQYSQYTGWQSQTRGIARQVSATDGPILVDGRPIGTAAALRAGVQSDTAFTFRMQQLTGRDVITCASVSSDCSQTAGATSGTNPSYWITTEGGTAKITFADQ